jgi:hypothetical protein
MSSGFHCWFDLVCRGVRRRDLRDGGQRDSHTECQAKRDVISLVFMFSPTFILHGGADGATMTSYAPRISAAGKC